MENRLGEMRGHPERLFDNARVGIVCGCALAYWEVSPSLGILLLRLWPDSPCMASSAPRAQEEVVVVPRWWQVCFGDDVLLIRAGGKVDLE